MEKELFAELLESAREAVAISKTQKKTAPVKETDMAALRRQFTGALEGASGAKVVKVMGRKLPKRTKRNP